jgi:predicted PurR-regulated permease PerM
MKRETVFHASFLALFVFAAYQFLVIAEPFLTPILGATVLAIVAFPLHRAIGRLAKRMNANTHAALSTLVVVALVIIPFAGMIWVMLNEADTIVPMIQGSATRMHQWYQLELRPWIDRLIPAIHKLPLASKISTLQVQKGSSMVAAYVIGKISAIGPALAANTLITTLNLIILTFALFFLLRDGEKGVTALRKWLPMTAKDKERILARIEQTVLGVVRGSTLTIIFQLITATIGYLIVGIPAAITLGLLTGLATVIPVAGAAVVWLPTAVYLFLFSAKWKGVVLLIWGGVFVSLSDNILRTYLIGREARIPMFLLFIGLLGGLRVYGLRGLLIGPLLIAVVPVLLDIFETEYLSDR